MNIKLSERPIYDSSEDRFDADSKIVNKIYEFIQEFSNSQLTIAITGEWGIGKSSVLNMLKNKIQSQEEYIVVTFEPLIDGKLEIHEMIELFYLKLYRSLQSRKSNLSHLSHLVKKTIKHFASNIKFNTGLKLDTRMIGIRGGEASLSTEVDVGKAIGGLSEEVEKENAKNFSEQIKELNEELINKKITLYIFADEIDRLPSTYIINFLLFFRTLESLDNLICIAGIDYEQIIKKLMNENYLGLCDYEHAQNYLDKLFQIRFPVKHNTYSIFNYALSILHQLNIFHEDFYGPNDIYQYQSIQEIINYLSTPRQIKKWIIALVANQHIIKGSLNKLAFISFIAVTIKHPIIIDYMSKYTLKYWVNDASDLYIYLLKNFNNDSSTIEQHSLLMATMGLINLNHRSKDFDIKCLKSIINLLGLQEIQDDQAGKYISNYLKVTPKYLAILFIESGINKEEIEFYSNFFSDNKECFEKSLNLILSEHMNPSQIHDLARILTKKPKKITHTPDISLLNEIWKKRVSSSPYDHTAFIFVLLELIKLLPLEYAIDNANLAYSEAHIRNILSLFGIKDNIQEFTPFNTNLMLADNIQNLTFNKMPLSGFDENTILEIIKTWIEKAESTFKKRDFSICFQHEVLNILYRYIQWSKFLKLTDKENILADFFVKFFNENTITQEKKEIIKEKFRQEKKKTSTSPINFPCIYKVLFNDNEDVLYFFK